MSKLIFPFMFKRNVVSRHNIKHILPSLNQGKFFTGAKTGEIIVWQQSEDDYVSKLLLVPCLNQNVGPLTSMTTICMPEPELMVYSELCLVTTHTDNRIRVWDTNDGRCISISPHDIFVNEQEIKEMRPLFDNMKRFIACLGSSYKVYIVDIWKMRCCKVISGSDEEKIINFQVFKNKEILYITDQLSYYSLDISELYNSDVYEYGNYILNIQNVNAILKETVGVIKAKKTIPKELNLDEVRLTYLPLLDFLFVPDTQMFVLVYQSKISFFDREAISKLQDEKMKHLNLFLNNIKTIVKATLAKIENNNFLLVSTKRGDLIFVNLDEIYQLWQFHTSGNNPELAEGNDNYRIMKIQGSHYCNVYINPIFIINQKYEQIMFSHERDSELIAMGKNIISYDSATSKLISLEVIEQTFNFYDLAQNLATHPLKYSFLKKDSGESKEAQEFIRKISAEDSILKMTDEHKKYFVDPYLTFSITNHMPKSSAFPDLFHSFFVNHFRTDLSNIMRPNEKVTVTTMAYHRKVEPLYIFGTNLGRVLVFQLFYSTHDQSYTYYSMNVDEGNEINILYVRKSLLFCSSEKGKLVVYSIEISDISKAAIQNKKEERGPNLFEIEISTLKKFESMLVAPLKRVLRVKLLSLSDDDVRKLDENYIDSVKRYKDQIALILKNNSLVTFSCQNVKIEFECKSNEISVLGVFIQPMLDYLLVLNANGTINLYSTNTGRYERTVSLKDYSYLMNLPDLISNYAKHYHEHHRYSASNESINKYGSRIHGVLEYNSRYLKNFLFRMEKEKEKNNEGKYQILSERLGNIEELNLNKMNNSQLLWLLHYSNDFIYASKYKRSGVAFLNLYLDNPVASDDNLASMAHILVIDAKTCFQQKSSDQKKMEESKGAGDFKLVRRKSRAYTLDVANSRVTITPFIFPWGIDSSMDEEIISTCGYKIPVFDFYNGLQGIGETFSFLLTDDKSNKKVEAMSPLRPKKEREKVFLRLDNWQTSNYFTTIQALGFMLYFILTSHNEDERILTTAIMRTVDLLNSKCVKLIPNFKPISVNLLTHLCPVDDADLIASACNLIVSAILHLEKPINSDLIIRFYQYIKTSTSHAEKSSQTTYPVENFETVLLASLSYWVCFYDSKDDKIYLNLHGEIGEYCFHTLMKVIEISYCLHNPYAVSAGLKLLVDGISVYKKFITKLEDLFFNIILINFHYSASLDDNIKSSRDLTNITNPIASKFKNILEEINKQTPDIRRLIRQMSLKALLSLGASYQKEFVFFVIKEAKNIALNLHYPSIVIEIIRNYVKKYRNKSLNELPRLVEGILYCLDPNNPVLRKSSHKAASHALQTIFRLYENVSFHQLTQRFALGAMDNAIIIYDLRTAVKLKTLEGHTAPVSCLAFSNSGKFLASFSYQEGSLRIWKVGGASGFLTSVFGVSSKHIKKFEIPKQSYQKGDSALDHIYVLEFTEDEKHVKLAIDDASGFAFDIQ